MSNVLHIWQGSASFYPGGTPFGYYDNDPRFQTDAESTAKWAGLRLGHLMSDVELDERHFFTAFEEAVFEYSNIINTNAARDNLVNLMGLQTSSIQPESLYLPGNFTGIINIAKNYGSEVGTGGNLTYFTGSVNLQPGKQVYNFFNTNEISMETGSFSGNSITIRKIFHQPQYGLFSRYGQDGSIGIESEFGWQNTINSFLVMPIYEDLQYMQHAEYSNQIRRSAYTFQITKDRLRIFPIPRETGKLFFHYSIDSENSSGGFSGNVGANPNSGIITSVANAPYINIVYSTINGMGIQWIRKYMLAVSKEILGYIRSKYASLPIPDGEITLNGESLLSSAKEEQDALKAELKETLDGLSRQAQMERKVAEAENLNKQLSYFPTRIYVR